MAKARRILKRVNAVKNIRTITRTMEMVSTARYQRTSRQAQAIRPYTDRLIDLVGDLLDRYEGQIDHPLVTGGEGVQHDVLMILTGNRGLCGGHNSSVMRTGLDRMRQVRGAGYELELHVVGRKGLQYAGFRNVEVNREMEAFDQVPSFGRVGRIAEEYMERFLAREIGGLEVAYARAGKAGQGRPVVAQILPLTVVRAPRRTVPTSARVPYEFYPSPREVLRNLLPATVRLKLYQCYLDAMVTEQTARISSMRTATENADEMVDKLSIQYNRMRQSQITTELSEIIGGRAGQE